MDTLRDVELQLSRVVAVVQQRLLSCDALHSQTQTQGLDSETETEDEFDQDKESFSGVSCKRMRESEGGDEEDEPETKHPFSRKERVAREKQLKVSIKKYTQSVGGVGKMDETAEKKELKQQMGTLGPRKLNSYG
ncbi:hypothetical protein GQ600_7763 [Phytophthora cactorum]|nr:hypothetical protein GQ600_7763 [Phytophthora cactorum]